MKEKVDESKLRQEIINLETLLNQDEILDVLANNPTGTPIPVYFSAEGRPLALPSGVLVNYLGLTRIEVKDRLSQIFHGPEVIVIKMTCSTSDGKAEDHIKISFKFVNNHWVFKDITLTPLEIFVLEDGEEAWLINERYSLRNRLKTALACLSAAKTVLEM